MTTTEQQQPTEEEKINHMIRRPGKAAMRHVFMKFSKTERYICPKCYHHMYHGWHQRPHNVLSKTVLSHPDGSPIQCYHCKKLFLYQRQKYKGPTVNGTVQRLVITITMHTRHPVNFLHELRHFLGKNKDPYEITYTKTPLPKEKKKP